ncbi:NUDIX hydrolase [Methylocella silvestris BL2]|uniref:NUDIX hydrolase n=1 Tax=Methylocella silvestris (strain DSM 15510 / CIP 108128 / LMG 27833 / NCIMB 13906 / BL2) TaxID=395965 RepID=B8ENW3_METSB|nr:NUDIX hydrolase [Methylocella silvestris]ACK49201.1 NUDIX hydrolase [Methylocella silvestris BL2]
MSKPPVRKPSPVSLQYGALPYRFTHAGALEILLITTRRSRRWIVPKGDPIKGLNPAKSAAREAFEEAGVRGAVADKPFGSFRFHKTLEGAPNLLCQVRIYPLLVKEQMHDWPEAHQRDLRWFEPAEAQNVVNDKGLQELIGRFAEKMEAKAARVRKSAAATAAAPAGPLA